VIAYQMLSGHTPFNGDFTQVMEAHKSAPIPPFKVKKVRKKLRRTIFSALEKEPEDRPQSAEAFATILRSRSEGISGLLRRAGMIYTEHITKFIGLSAIFMAPMMVLTTILVAVGLLEATQQISGTTRMLISAPFGILQFFATSLGAYLVIGTSPSTRRCWRSSSTGTDGSAFNRRSAPSSPARRRARSRARWSDPAPTI
jgi:serine/threonine protein kinase